MCRVYRVGKLNGSIGGGVAEREIERERGREREGRVEFTTRSRGKVPSPGLACRNSMARCRTEGRTKAIVKAGSNVDISINIESRLRFVSSMRSSILHGER